MKNKTKYYLFITLLVFIGLIVAVGLFLAAGFSVNVFVPQRFGDLPFVTQFLLLAVVFFFIYPAIMVLISNVYLKTSGKKTWGNWLKIPLNYNSIFTVIAVYQCAFLVIEVLVFCNMTEASYTFEKVIMFTVPFIMFFFIILRSRWKIVIKGEQISSTTYFGKTKTCTFDDITRAKQGVGHTKVGTIYSMTAYNEKKKLFVLTDHCSGYKEFIQRLKDEGVNIEW